MHSVARLFGSPANTDGLLLQTQSDVDITEYIEHADRVKIFCNCAQIAYNLRYLSSFECGVYCWCHMWRLQHLTNSQLMHTVSKGRCAEQKASRQWNFCGQYHLVNNRGGSRMGRLVKANQKATSAMVTAQCHAGGQECTALNAQPLYL